MWDRQAKYTTLKETFCSNPARTHPPRIVTGGTKRNQKLASPIDLVRGKAGRNILYFDPQKTYAKIYAKYVLKICAKIYKGGE